MRLLSFQNKVVVKVLREYKKGLKKMLIVFPTGLGKTIIVLTIAKLLRSKRVLFLSHRKELRTQALEKAGLLKFDNLVSATVQSVSRNPIKYNHRIWDIIIVDEAHHSEAPMYRKILGVLRTKLLLGLTATPDRTDQQSLLSTFETLIYKLSIQDAIDQNLFVKIFTKRRKTNIRWNDHVGKKDKEYTEKSLRHLIVPQRDKIILEEWEKNCKNRRTIGFTINVWHANMLAELWRRRGYRAAAISGRTPDLERQSIVEQFKSGRIDTIFACDVLNEGFDCPDADVILMTRPTLSKLIYLQQVGRALRNPNLFQKGSSKKQDILVIDFTDNSKTFGLSANEVFDSKIYDSKNDIRSLRKIKDTKAYIQRYDHIENREVELIECTDLDSRTKTVRELWLPVLLELKRIGKGKTKEAIEEMYNRFRKIKDAGKKQAKCMTFLRKIN